LDSPLEGDETLMFPLDLETEGELSWGRASTKTSQKDIYLSSPSQKSRSQPMAIRQKKFIPKKSKLNYSSSSSSSATSSFSSSTKSGNKSSHKVPLERQRSPTKQIIQCTQKKTFTTTSLRAS